MRLSFDQVEALHEALQARLLHGEVQTDEYVSEWDELLRLSGWSEDELVKEIDRRWSMSVPVKLRRPVRC